MATIGTAPAYDAEVEPWANYAERSEQFFVGNRIIDDKQKTGIFLSCVGPKTYGLLRSLLTPIKPSTKTFEELLGTLKQHFSPRPSEIMEQYTFNSRSQQEEETISEFLAALWKLTEFFNFGDTLDFMIRDRLVCGVRDVGVQKRMLAESALTLEKATRIALAVETASKNASDLRGEGSNHPQVNNVNERAVKDKHVERFPRNKAPQSQGHQHKKCGRCGNSDHDPKILKDAKSGATLANVKQSSQLEQRGPGERPRSVSKTQVDVPALGIHESKVEDSNALRPGETGHASQKKNFNYPWVNEEPDRGDYTPTDLAEYILRTGDEEGVALAVEELLRQGMMTREEAIVYLQDVKAEMNYIRAQQEKLRRIQELREAINMKKKDESVFKHRMNDVLGAKETVLPPNSHISAKAASANQQSIKPQKATQSKLHTAADRPSSTAAPSLKNTAPISRVGQGDVGKASGNKVTSSGKLTPVDLDRMTEERVPPRSQPEADVVSILKKLKGATSLYDEYTLEEIIYWLAKDMFAHSIIKGQNGRFTWSHQRRHFN
ncbi:hypothetical protein ISCGN_004161 [Ixodes scapularis]